MYKFKKSLMGLIGLVTLVTIATVTVPHIGRGASGTGNSAPSSQTQNVNVVNTPSVNVASMPTVNVDVANTSNNPIPIVAPTPQTVLASTETRNIGLASTEFFGPYDVSGFRDVRLSFKVWGNNCLGKYQIYLSDGVTDAFTSDSFDQQGLGGSTLISVPGHKIEVLLMCQLPSQGTVTLEVYGRP